MNIFKKLYYWAAGISDHQEDNGREQSHDPSTYESIESETDYALSEQEKQWQAQFEQEGVKVVQNPSYDHSSEPVIETSGRCEDIKALMEDLDIPSALASGEPLEEKPEEQLTKEELETGIKNLEKIIDSITPLPNVSEVEEYAAFLYDPALDETAKIWKKVEIGNGRYKMVPNKNYGLFSSSRQQKQQFSIIDPVVQVQYTLKDAIVEVLKINNKPLHYKDIWKEISNRKMFTSKGKTPESTVSYTINTDLKKKNTLFVRVSPGVFTLI